MTWGPNGTTLHRDGMAAGSQKAIDAVSSDPAIKALHLGGPGSGGSPRFRGDVAEVRVYHRQLDDAGRKRVEAELHRAWFEPADPRSRCRGTPSPSSTMSFYPRGGPSGCRRTRGRRPYPRGAFAPGQPRSRAGVAQEEASTGDPTGGRGTGRRSQGHASRGLQGCPGLHSRQSQAAREDRAARLSTRPDDRRPDTDRRRQRAPATGRLAGKPRSPAHGARHGQPDLAAPFRRGAGPHRQRFRRAREPPSDPELLDHLAARFVESGWSLKAMHRMVLLSATYQQGSRADAAGPSRDPENRLFGRANRRRLDAEAIRDSLLVVTGRLDRKRAGPASWTSPCPGGPCT